MVTTAFFCVRYAVSHPEAVEDVAGHDATSDPGGKPPHDTRHRRRPANRQAVSRPRSLPPGVQRHGDELDAARAARSDPDGLPTDGSADSRHGRRLPLHVRMLVHQRRRGSERMFLGQRSGGCRRHPDNSGRRLSQLRESEGQ